MTGSYSVTAPLWLWAGDKGNWHFLTVSGDAADAIRFDTLGLRGGFGSVRVVARVGDVEWATSLFPSGDNWILPVKADIRRRANLAAGDELEVTLKLAGLAR